MDKKITAQILDALPCPAPLLVCLTDGRSLRECTELTPYTSSNTSDQNSLQTTDNILHPEVILFGTKGWVWVLEI